MRWHVYRLFSPDGHLLYVGHTRDLDARLQQHSRDRPWWHQAASYQSEDYPSEAEARAREYQIWATEGPAYNRIAPGLQRTERWYGTHHTNAGLLLPSSIAVSRQNADGFVVLLILLGMLLTWPLWVPWQTVWTWLLHGTWAQGPAYCGSWPCVGVDWWPEIIPTGVWWGFLIAARHRPAGTRIAWLFRKCMLAVLLLWPLLVPDRWVVAAMWWVTVIALRCWTRSPQGTSAAPSSTSANGEEG